MGTLSTFPIREQHTLADSAVEGKAQADSVEFGIKYLIELGTGINLSFIVLLGASNGRANAELGVSIIPVNCFNFLEAAIVVFEEERHLHIVDRNRAVFGSCIVYNRHYLEVVVFVSIRREDVRENSKVEADVFTLQVHDSTTSTEVIGIDIIVLGVFLTLIFKGNDNFGIGYFADTVEIALDKR